MNNDQQRTVDAAIAGDRLVDAIHVYRMATGAGVDDAKAYVASRSSAPDFNPTPPAVPKPAPPATQPAASSDVVLAEPRPKTATHRALTRLTYVLAIVAGVAVVAVVATSSGFGTAWFDRPAYATRLEALIATDPQFIRELGAPLIPYDDTSCGSQGSAPPQRPATCDVMVHGSRRSGRVHVQLQDQQNGFRADLWLHVGERVIQSAVST